MPTRLFTRYLHSQAIARRRNVCVLVFLSVSHCCFPPNPDMFVHLCATCVFVSVGLPLPETNTPRLCFVEQLTVGFFATNPHFQVAR